MRYILVGYRCPNVPFGCTGSGTGESPSKSDSCRSLGQANARIRDRRVHYRVLYFFDGPAVAVIALGCTKEDEVGDAEIDRAAQYRNAFLSDRLVHLA